MHVQRASSRTYGIYHFRAESTVIRVTRYIYLDFALICDLSFSVMSKVKATKTSKMPSVLQDFPEDFVLSPNYKLYDNMCSCSFSCIKHCLVESHRNTSKHQKALDRKSYLLIPHTSQTFLRSRYTDFVERITIYQSFLAW